MNTRILPKFTYLEPKTVEEAVSMLTQYNGEAKLMAGGTDLFILMQSLAVTPKAVINLKSIPKLKYISGYGGSIHIAAQATLRDLKSPL